MRRAFAAALAVLALAVLALAGCTHGLAREVPAPDGEPGRSNPVADPVYPQHGNPDLDVLAYRLELSWAPTEKTLTGRAALTIRIVKPVTALTLDFLSSYQVSEMTVDGVAVAPERRGDDLIATTPKPLPAEARTTLVVGYRGVPHAVAAPTGRGDLSEGLGLRATADGSAWTMQEPFGAFTWYPVSDQPSDEAVYDIAVTVPTGWTAVASGTPAGMSGSTFRYVSTDPVASYVTTLAIGKYEKVTDTGPHGLPLTYWVRSGDRDALPVLRRTPELLGWLEAHFGPYPFPSAGAVVVDSNSAMETQQMVTLGTGASREADVLLHEYSHQWFGDSVTPPDWRGVWLNEGFAMYAQALWSIDHGDREADWIAWARQRDKESRAAAGPPGAYQPNHFAENNVYVGPLLMLHEIHQEIGDTAFYALARDWVQTQRNKPVDRATFTEFVHRHTGRDFGPVIDEWLDSPTTPA